MKTKIELLAPAGNYEKLTYALAYGADAVYAGIPRYSLRTRENDFTIEVLEQAVRYCRNLNKKIYLTLNIFPHNRKLDSVKDILSWMATVQPDGIIISDPGVIRMAGEQCPQIPIHLSTQANTVNWSSVKFWQKMGVRRIILSRELSLSEITEIRQRVPDVELESFVHGSICIAYSGRCLLSNYFNYRDSNQGTCTNSCRWLYRLYRNSTPAGEEDAGRFFLEEDQRRGEYLPVDEDEHGTYIMNSKDLCAVHLLDKLARAGVNSFKIEGRSKSIYYVSIATRAYRRALDSLLAGNEISTAAAIQELHAIANRGYTGGFLDDSPRAASQNYLESQPVSFTHQYCGVVRSIDPGGKRIQVSVRNPIFRGEELELITPQLDQRFTVEEIITPAGEKIDRAHGGGTDVWIPCACVAAEYALLRREIKLQTS
jgi:U32 family peptidase